MLIHVKQSSEMLYTSLWNIITAINSLENNICSLQIVREPLNGSLNLVYNYQYRNVKVDSLMDFAVKVMDELSMPIIVVDIMRKTRDLLYYQEIRGAFIGTPIHLRYIHIIIVTVDITN